MFAILERQQTILRENVIELVDDCPCQSTMRGKTVTNCDAESETRTIKQNFYNPLWMPSKCRNATVVAELLLDLVEIRSANDADLDALASLGQEGLHFGRRFLTNGVTQFGKWG